MTTIEYTGEFWIPSEIIMRILGYIQDGRSVLACRCVSKYFHVCSMDPSVAWLKIESRLLVSCKPGGAARGKNISYKKVVYNKAIGTWQVGLLSFCTLIPLVIR